MALVKFATPMLALNRFLSAFAFSSSSLSLLSLLVGAGQGTLSSYVMRDDDTYTRRGTSSTSEWERACIVQMRRRVRNYHDNSKQQQNRVKEKLALLSRWARAGAHSPFPQHAETAPQRIMRHESPLRCCHC